MRSRVPVIGSGLLRFAFAATIVCSTTPSSAVDAHESQATSPPSANVVSADGETNHTSQAVEQTQFINTTLLPSLLQANPLFRTAPAPLIPGLAQRDALSRQLASAPRQQRRRRLSRVPSMFGDFFFPTATVFSNAFATQINGQITTAQIPVAGGSARTKIGENNKAVPVDRIYANWNHYHNAITRQSAEGFGTAVDDQTASFDRITVGFERTLFDGNYSIEMRLPLSLYPSLSTNANNIPFATFAADTGNLGNLSIIGKAVLLEFENTAYSAGLGLELPTGSDGSVTSNDSIVELENEAILLHPFLAMTEKRDNWFLNAFVQLDLPMNGNPLTVIDTTNLTPTFVAGKVDPQSLFHFDVSIGRWLMRDTNKTGGLTGVAAILEYHFVNTLEDADTVAYAQNTGLGPLAGSVGQGANHITSMNLTAGLHLEFANNFMVRVATVHPLKTGDDKLFDSEFMLQVGRRF